MDLALTDDQKIILDAIDSMCRNHEAAPIHDAPLAATNAALSAEIAQSGFLDVAFDPDLGAVTGALVIERLARLPIALEVSASTLVRPLIGEDVVGPVCLVDAHKPHRPVPFLAEGVTVIVVGETVSMFTAKSEHVRPEPEALYAYPMATLLSIPDDATQLDIDVEDVKSRWRVGLAAEAAGLLSAALNSTREHISDRKQFGRALATFQALRHRMAEAQVRTNGVYWLTMKAAASLDPSETALAALHAQESARHCVYDFHQFLGAMGMTLEHPLHLWTYRLKYLIGALGGRGGQAVAAADALWPREDA